MSRILIVEDELHLADGLRFNLEADEHEVDYSETGEDALQKLTTLSKNWPNGCARNWVCREVSTCVRNAKRRC